MYGRNLNGHLNGGSFVILYWRRSHYDTARGSCLSASWDPIKSSHKTPLTTQQYCTGGFKGCNQCKQNDVILRLLWLKMRMDYWCYFYNWSQRVWLRTRFQIKWIFLPFRNQMDLVWFQNKRKIVRMSLFHSIWK